MLGVPPLGRYSGLVGSLCDPFCELPYGVALTPGQHEEPTPDVRRSALGRAEMHPFRIEPETGKVFENRVESETKVPWDILNEKERRSGLVE